MRDEQTIEAPAEAPDNGQPPTGGGDPVLPEVHRKKLDSIVQAMHDNGEKDADIQAVVDDFKKKYSAVPASSKTPNKEIAPNNITDVSGLLKATNVKTPLQQQQEQVTEAKQHVTDAFNNIDPLAHKVVAEDKLADLQKQFGQTLNHPGSDATRLSLPGPQHLPDHLQPTTEEVQQAKATPEGQRRLLNRQVQELHKEGKTAEANKLQASLYTTDRGEADTDEKARQRLGNAKELEEGNLKYSPVTQKLIKPTGLGESVTDAWDKRNEDIALFDAADDKSDKDLAAHLDYLLKQQNDPDKPQHVPKGLAGATGQFLGDQGPIGAVATAAAAIPVAGEAIAGGLYAHEMGRRTYGQELLRTYADLRQQHPEMTPEEAVAAAKEHAKRAGLIDAVTGAALGATTGALGKAKVGEGEVPGLATASIPKPTGMLTKAVTKGYDFLKESLPAGAKNAALFAGGTVAKNASAQVAGTDRDITEGTLEAASTALGYHLAFGLLGKGLTKLQVGVKKAVLQGMSKLPTAEVAAIANEQVQHGTLTPQEGQAAVEAIGEHKELDAQVPDKVKNDEVRLDLQKKIQRRQELEQELATVNKAFHPEVKEKIKALDEKMNEIASSPEAKQETSEPVGQTASRETPVEHKDETTEPVKPKKNEQVQPTESKTGPSTGNTEPGSTGVLDREKEVRQEGNGEKSGGGEKEIKPEKNAIPERSTAPVLQREPGETAEAGSERGRVEQSEQGATPAGESAPAPEKSSPKPVPKEKVKAKEALTEEVKKVGLSDDEKFVLKNSYPEYKKQNPDATQDEYNVKRAAAYKKQVALRNAPMDKLEGAPVEVNGKQNSVEQYVDKAKAVLGQLFPEHTLTAHPTEAQYLEQERRPVGSMGVSHAKEKRIALNMERIRDNGAENTVFHETIHPIVEEALQSKPGAVDAAYSKLVDMKKEKGMEAVWRHEDLYRDRGLATVKVEAITEFLTQVADGKIDPSKMSLSLSTRIIDVVNKVLKALGSNKVFSTAADLRRLADSVKQAFAKADAKPVEAALGSNRKKAELETSLDKLQPGSDEERQLKQLIAKYAEDLDDTELKDAFVDAGHDPADIDRLISEVNDERTKGPEALVREAHEKGTAALAQGKLAPPEKTAIAKASLSKTLKRWFYDKQDEVTDVKSIIRQNKGKEEHELDQIYHASNKVRDFWNTVPKEKQEAFIVAMERPDLQKGWTSDMKNMADMYRDRLQKTFDTIKQAMPDINFIEDYFPHFWEKPDEVKNFFANSLAKAPLEGSKGFAQKRSFDNILPGIEKGYELTTTNPEELVRLAEANAWKFQTARNIFDDMKKMGYLKFSTAADLPADWKGVDDKLFNRMGAYVTKDGEANIAKGQYMMPPEVAKLMNNYLSVGIKNPIKNVVNKWNNVKNMFQLGMGMFHFTTTGVESLINGVTTGVQKISTGKPMNIAKGLGEITSSATVVPNIVQSVRRGLRARSDYFKGLKTDDVQNLIDVNAKVGRQKMYSLDTWYNTKKAFGQLKADKDFSKIPKLAFNALMSLPEAINKPLMEHWVPALKVGGYLRSLESEIASRGKMNPRELQQAKEKIWDSMDDRLGQVVYDNVFVNKSAKDLAFMAIRSAGWTGGTIRTAIKGAGEIPLSASRVVKGKGLSQRTADLIAMPLTVGFFGGMLHYLSTGQPPQETKDYFFPKDGTKNPDGTDHRVTLPSYMKDYLAYSKSPAQTLVHKTSPALNDIVELYQNKDFYGEKIYNEDDPAFQKGLDILKHQVESLEPFSFKENPYASVAPAKQQIEQKFGIMAAPKERERSETQNAIMKAYVNQLGSGEGAKTHEQMEKQVARRHLHEFLYNGGTWDDADPDMKEKADIKKVQDFIKESQINPYERYFKSLKKEKRQEVFDAMPDDEQEIYKKYMK